MFDGSFKSGRKVNLSGRKPIGRGSSFAASTAAAALSAKEELMRQTKLAREGRLALKLRTNASTKIQSVFRRVAAGRRARTAVFAELENEMTQVVRTTSMQSVSLANAVLQRFVQQFLFAHGAYIGNDGPADHWPALINVSTTRLRNVQDHLVLMLLVSCYKGVGPEMNYLATRKDSRWIYQAKRLIEISLQIITPQNSVGNFAKQPIDSYLVLTDALTNTRNYSRSDQDHAAFERIVYQLAVNSQWGTFDALSECIKRQNAHDGATSFQDQDRIIHLISRTVGETIELALKSVEHRSILHHFARKLVLTPCAGSSSMMQHVLAVLLAQEAGYVTSEEQLWQTTITFFQKWLVHQMPNLLPFERTIAIGNVMDAMVKCAFTSGVVQVGSIVMGQIITPSLVRWAFGADKVDTDSNFLVPDDDFDSTQQVLQPLALAFAKPYAEEVASITNALREIESRVKEQWQQLCDSDSSRRCFHAVLDNEDVLMEGDTADPVTSLCDVYATIIMSVSQSYSMRVKATFAPPVAPVLSFLSAMTMDQIQDGNTTKSPTVKGLWNWLYKKMDPKKTVRSTNESTSPAYPASQLRTLMAFNVVYSHLLLGLDDETFYDRKWPMQLTEVASVVSFLKSFIYETCWKISSTTSQAKTSSYLDEDESILFATVTTSVKLFNQLYDRDSRRRFTADEAWLWPSMPTIKETVDLETMDEGLQLHTQALYMLVSGAASSAITRTALLLVTIPQVFAFKDRVLLFEKLLDEEKQQLASVRDEFSRAIQVRIRRDEIVDTSFELFQKLCEEGSPAALKARIKVAFVNEQGLDEAGIDGGGVFKEYLDQLTKQAFSPEYGLFLATENQLLYPNPSASLVGQSPHDVIDQFRFRGRVLAKALYENMLVEPQFSAFFLNKLLGKFNYIDDLYSLDPELYQSLMKLKHFNGDVEDLALTFSINETVFGQVVSRDLIPNGDNVGVTNENRIRYMHVLANYKLNVQSARESAAFLKGFRDLIPASWIQMFNPSELQMLIGGDAHTIDVKDWQKNTLYGGGYHPSQLIIQWFWEIVANEFNDEERAALLKFITSCSRQPLRGFAHLSPQICIHQVRITEDSRLPSSATCMNLLKLPAYSSKEIMCEKLRYAISANAGFDLS